MKKNGFTLIELLATLTILAILAVIVFPNVFGAISRSRESAYEQQVDSIINGSRNYFADHAELLPGDGLTAKVTVGELKNGNYIDKEIENPKTGEIFSDSSYVQVKNTNENYKYTYHE